MLVERLRDTLCPIKAASILLILNGSLFKYIHIQIRLNWFNLSSFLDDNHYTFI